MPDRRYCGSKNVYDKRGAETVRNQRWQDDHVRLRIYHCPKCGGWHVTRKNA